MSRADATGTQSELSDLTHTILSASCRWQISAACNAIESYLRQCTPDQSRQFFLETFSKLLLKIFGFEDSSSASGWIDIAALSDDFNRLAGRIVRFLSPTGLLLSSIAAMDRSSSPVYYLFREESLPGWLRYMLQNKRDAQALSYSCPLLKNILEVPNTGSYQFWLCAFEYYMFWFAYYPIFRGNSENPIPHVISRELEWFDYVNLIMGGPSEPERRSEDNLYMRLLGAYLRAYVPLGDRNARIPLQRSLSHDTPAEFLVNTLIQFWIVNNDFSPLPVELFKSFPLLSARDKTPPASGLGEVVNMFVKYYLNPRRKETGTAIIVQSSNMRFQRPLYRFILRTFLYCPMESIKNASQVFTLWVSYLEPWTVYMEELDANKNTLYSPSWQDFVLANYLFYSSLIMHFIRFAHKGFHIHPKEMFQMVSKVMEILTSSAELTTLIKTVDNNLHEYVPSIREQLKDWENGLSECEIDASFLHEDPTEDFGIFSDGEDGGQKSLQLFVSRVESQLHSLGRKSNIQSYLCLERLKSELGQLFDGPVSAPKKSRDEIFDDWMNRPVSDDEIAWLVKLLVKLSGWLNGSLWLTHVERRPRSFWSDFDLYVAAQRVNGTSWELLKFSWIFFCYWFYLLREDVPQFMRQHGFRVNLRVFALKKVVVPLLIIATSMFIIATSILLARAFAA